MLLSVASFTIQTQKTQDNSVTNETGNYKYKLFHLW